MQVYMKKYISCFIIFCSMFLFSCNSITTRKLNQNFVEQLQLDIKNSNRNLLLQKDAVPDEETAIKIAEAVLIPIYGDKVLEQRPFKCKLVKDSVWYIKGNYEVTWTDEGLLTGRPVAEVYIHKKNGGILRITDV